MGPVLGGARNSILSSSSATATAPEVEEVNPSPHRSSKGFSSAGEDSEVDSCCASPQPDEEAMSMLVHPVMHVDEAPSVHTPQDSVRQRIMARGY